MISLRPRLALLLAVDPRRGRAGVACGRHHATLDAAPHRMASSDALAERAAIVSLAAGGSPDAGRAARRGSRRRCRRRSAVDEHLSRHSARELASDRGAPSHVEVMNRARSSAAPASRSRSRRGDTPFPVPSAAGLAAGASSPSDAVLIALGVAAVAVYAADRDDAAACACWKRRRQRRPGRLLPAHAGDAARPRCAPRRRRSTV